MNLKELKISYQKGLISKPEYISEMYKLHDRLFEYAEFINDTDISRIEITDNCVVMTSGVNSVKIVCDYHDKRIAPIETLNFNYYEKSEFDFVCKIIEQLNNFGATILDIGANVGWYSLNLAKQFPKMKVFSFEPIPSTFESLKKNIGINHVDNIQEFNFGFSNLEKTLTFYYYPEGSGNASSANLTNSLDVQEIPCTVKRLDDFINESNLSIDFIKCDVEGAELLVFQGGIDSIRKYKPVIFTEMLRKWSKQFNYHPNEIITLLSALGYQCFTIKDGSFSEFISMDESTIETNFFFLHSSHHSQQIEILTSL